MARSLRGFSRPRAAGGSLRRKSSWDIGPGASALQSVTISESVVVGAGALATEDGLTLVRLRGEFLFQLTGAQSIGTGFRGAFGIGIANATAFGVGVTALQTPLTNEEWDGWLFHQYFHVFASGAVVVGNAADEQNQLYAGGSGIRMPVDSKAMRKLITEDVIYAIIEVVESSSAADFIFRSRILLKLP